MRSYILTDREREIVKTFLKTKDVHVLDYDRLYQIRHFYRKNGEAIRQDLELLNQLMEASK